MREGGTELPAFTKPSAGPAARTAEGPFFNPAMALNRDLSTLMARAERHRRGREIDVADPLAGSGARSLRWATEVPGIVVHANDADPRFAPMIQGGVAANELQSPLHAHTGDAHAFLATQRFDIVDLDPCGSPMPFLDAGIRATRHDGLLCVTATDTGALCGTYPKACLRRYDAHHGLHAQPWRAEVGLRILAGAIVRAAARFDRAAVIVASIAEGHWMRVVARIGDGKKDATQAVQQLAFAVAREPAGGFVARGRPLPTTHAGPAWSGPLHSGADLDLWRAAGSGPLNDRPRLEALLALVRGEADAAPFWVVPDLLATRLGPPPRRDALIARLLETGIPAARTHMDPQGIRTSATVEQLSSAWN